MDVVNVSMEAGKSLTVRTMEDLFLRDTSLRVRTGDEIFLSAQRDLMLNGVHFSDKVREIYMQATTIDLLNINFPRGAVVDLATHYGGIDGKYPTFPTGNPNKLMGNREVGRVNFIQNVGYDKNVMNNRAQFDKFGQNIHINVRQP